MWCRGRVGPEHTPVVVKVVLHVVMIIVGAADDVLCATDDFR